ncbi:MAG TPA: Zn-dependent hydrolase, partial [Candidatus Pelethomonas intestinigallinarum]|nr:Zn-dependent hydrolase [Candidatus Pelethomonas intestinigallinarum]
MRQTFITTMPDHVGAFLQASRAMAQLGLNITRVSYNRAIDVHTLFIEAEGEEDALARAVERLEEIGYLRGQPEAAVLLVAFRLRDVPGAVTAALELIQQYDFNISYLSSQADSSGFQEFKMGLVVDDRRRFADFLNAAARLCPVRVIDYDKTEKILDNSVFYVSFASELAQRMGLGRDSRTELLVNINRAMQLLDERSEPFHKA